MISLDEAITTAVHCAPVLQTEQIHFISSLNKILAEDIYSDIAIPPFNKSAMDGYALKKEDVNKVLKIVQTVQAGDTPIKNINSGECVKIMTGARLPENADYVAKIEDTELNEQGLVLINNVENKSNIRYAAEDVKLNELILKKGTLIRPQEIATLATFGKTNVKVYSRPKIKVASTGNELTEPDNKPNDVQIRNSNSYQILAQCKKMGIEAQYTGIIKDNMEDTTTHIKKMLEGADVIIFSGGVSMGDYDFIPKAISELGFSTIFKDIAVQPGKPTLMAQKGNQFCFGLPGNPVSSFMQFELIIKPFLYKMMGYDFRHQTNYLPLAHSYQRKKAERTSLIPVKIIDNKIVPVDYHGSAHLFALNEADGFITISQNTTFLAENTYVTVRLL